jgi:F-type H+-transporting ATPase subunit c
VSQSSRIAALSIALMLLASPAFGAAEPAEEAAVTQPGPQGYSLSLGVALGTALIVIGAAYGISRIGVAAVESMARQPEAARSIQNALLIAGALIEGLTFFGLAVCLLKVMRDFMG